MSTAKVNSESEPEPSAVPGGSIELNAGIYAIVMSLCAFWISLTLWDAGRDMTAYVVGFLVIVMLLTRVWLVGLVFFGAVGFLFMDEPRVGMTVSEFAQRDVMFAASIIGFLISSCRYLSLTAAILPYRLNTLRETVVETVRFCSSIVLPAEQAEEEPETYHAARLEARSKSTVRVDEFMTGTFRLLLSMVGASLLLQMVPYQGVPEIERFGVQLPVLRVSTIVWVLIGVTAVSGLLLTPVSWMRHSKLQAGVYLRSTVTKWCFRDLRAIVKRLVSQRRKSLVTDLRRGKPTRVNLLDQSGGVVKAKRSEAGGRGVRLKG